MIRKLLIAICLIMPAAARAEWRVATSDNFIVYSPDGESALRESVAKLERLHFILRAMHNVTRPPSPIRLKIFLMRNAQAVAQSLPYTATGVNGYYESGLRGPMIVGTRSAGGVYRGLNPEVVLQHEYAHHFMFSYFPATYPTWYTEGFAEFWGSTRLLENDVFEVGVPAEDRLRMFGYGEWVPLNQILGARRYGDVSNPIMIYSEGWLLLRYLFENRERSGQLERYLNAINSGTAYDEAMNQAFGEGARELNEELSRYAHSPRFNVLRVPFRRIAVPEIRVRELRPAEEALLRQEIFLGQGVLQREIGQFASDVRQVAGRYPNDPYAVAMLVEAERLIGDNAAALAAANRLLALDPHHARGLAWKGVLEAEALRTAGSTDSAAWAAARAPVTEAVQRAPNDPIVLEAYYDSFVAQGVLPPAGAQNALFRALTLAPNDDYLRQKVAGDFEHRGMIADAITVIRPAALAMRHEGDESERERRRRERLRERFRAAGRPLGETPREMLTRLEAALPRAGQSAQAEAQH